MLAGTCSEGGGGGGGERERERENQILERENSNFSVDFPAFGSSVRIGPRSKVVLRRKGYAWAPVLWSFDNSKT